ncbi:TPA: MurR/RpiR family transcriptional regulator, partial [Klebsiella pneumoniae subsp. pneumoniae]|nr:MurR/RpiR family transcriptional regulator [Klebsiella pneumoniae subsp. pneumoniae]
MHSRLKGNEVFLLARMLAPELGKKERAIARFIDDNPQSLARMSITEIANYLKVSVSSITKVSKKLGFTGFHDLKLSVSNNMNAVENTVDIPVIPDSEKYVESVLESTFLNSVLALQESLNVIDCAVIKSV